MITRFYKREAPNGASSVKYIKSQSRGTFGTSSTPEGSKVCRIKNKPSPIPTPEELNITSRVSCDVRIESLLTQSSTLFVSVLNIPYVMRIAHS